MTRHAPPCREARPSVRPARRARLRHRSSGRLRSHRRRCSPRLPGDRAAPRRADALRRRRRRSSARPAQASADRQPAPRRHHRPQRRAAGDRLPDAPRSSPTRAVLEPREAAATGSPASSRTSTGRSSLRPARRSRELRLDQAAHHRRRSSRPVNALGMPGLEFRPEGKRVYPQGALAAHVVGFADIDNKGLAGVERELRRARCAPSAARRRCSSSLDLAGPVHPARASSRGGAPRSTPSAAWASSSTSRTGEVLAWCRCPISTPTIDQAPPTTTRFNRVTLGTYEMGSVFKIFTLAMALDAARSTLTTSGYDATQPLQIGRFTIHDDHAQRPLALGAGDLHVFVQHRRGARWRSMSAADAPARLSRPLGLLRDAAIELPEVAAPLRARSAGGRSTP